MNGNYRHGLRHKRIYNIWRSMRQRCMNPNCYSYKHYGAKGVSVCDEWQDPKVFSEWAYKNGYADDLTIDRIDVNGNYTPDNCRWVTQKVQQNNRRNNSLLEYNGVTHTTHEWSEIVHISYRTLWARINVRGWNVEKALTTPVRAIDTKFKKKSGDTDGREQKRIYACQEIHISGRCLRR